MADFILAAAFGGKKPDFARLEQFGFSAEDGAHSYTERIAGGQLDLRVSVRADGTVRAAVRDVLTGEPYILHTVPGASGPFVGQVRADYEHVLKRIAAECFERDVFKSPCSRIVIGYVRERFGSELEYLWEKQFPGNAVWRRADNRKWFGALLTVSRRKFGMDSDEKTEVINVRTAPETLPLIVNGTTHFPGYHMNKQHWISVLLDGSVPAQDIFPLIDASYALAAKR
ncbi:MAG: hypothetical protein HDR39_00290 [Treponema sp.]|nr:hypothetical protein [Treponema sp.]